ncbi:TonB-dependent receptor [Marinoscillum sp.]|uniref:TonB-dependent receptor n=1 Tax=Marinoscillum sp. TaxID=2024838 RepID=UPI003BA9B511
MRVFWMSMLAMIAVFSAYGQFNVDGKVVTATGESLPGANVWLNQSKYATSTDGDGYFMMSKVPAGTFELSVSFVGYETYTKVLQVDQDVSLEISLKENVIKGEEVFVYATRANEKTPTTFSNISNKEIEGRNMGQDLPFILQHTPSMVVTSDAGNGVGYTGIRIRGSDPTRINVTVNGVPINDSESHGTFWVNMPDMASSVNNIQIQRGIGTSTNGAAAFGASVNLQTDMPSQEAYAKVDNSFGSFNTWKHTVEMNTGLINKKWAFQGRLSQITSDGYLDRASADLKSYYLSGGYYGDKTTVKAVVFAGKEVTYQAWWGTPEARLNNDVDGMMEVIANNGLSDEQADNLLNSGRTYNYYQYDNEVDNYQQDHYQLHLSHVFNPNFNINGALHYTYGRGYYEQYRADDDLADYALPDVVIGDSTITSTDLIRRRWLDNDFYGFTYSANYSKEKWDLSLGGAWNKYDGDHFGEIIWAQYASTSAIRDRYYDNFGKKTDFNVYLKGNYQVSPKVNLFADAQVRLLDYHTKGVDSDLRDIDTGDNYAFFNPKVGLTYLVKRGESFYASYAIGNREPVRGDFVDAAADQIPKAETMHNLEVGYRKASGNYSYSANYYLMDYDNQLVLTGAVNDVGSSIRVNVPDSYRMGVELVGAVKVTDALTLSGNLTLSQNKIAEFTEVIYDYGPAFDEYNEIQNEYTDTDISFSPNVIGGSQISYSPLDFMEISLLSKYVSKQYLDNTSNDDRSIDAYFVNDLKMDLSFASKQVKQIGISLMVNNIFDVKYVSNGYTFGYAGGDYMVRENYYYPQAGTNFLAAVSLKF